MALAVACQRSQLKRIKGQRCADAGFGAEFTIVAVPFQFISTGQFQKVVSDANEMRKTFTTLKTIEDLKAK